MFFNHVVPAVIKPAHSLWNELIGFIFLCLAGLFGFQAVTAAIHQETGRLVVGGFCTLLMTWFGIGSFRRARKISRS